MAKLYFYYSAMNAGKSAVLLQSDHNYRERGLETMLFTPRLDDRAGEGVIASRIGLSRPAFAFESDFDFFVHIRQRHNEKRVNCVLIDECQFLSKGQVLQLSLVVDRLNIPVLCYGLRTDFRGEPFEGSMYLLGWADELNEIKTICHTGKKATMNARVDDKGARVWEGSVVSIGHHYVSMSRKEFQLEKASSVGYMPPPDANDPSDLLPEELGAEDDLDSREVVSDIVRLQN